MVDAHATQDRLDQSSGTHDQLGRANVGIRFPIAEIEVKGAVTLLRHAAQGCRQAVASGKDGGEKGSDGAHRSVLPCHVQDFDLMEG